MAIFSDLEKIINDRKYVNNNKKSKYSIYDGEKYSNLIKKQKKNVSPKEPIKWCESKIIEELTAASLKATLCDLIRAYNYLFSCMYDARENNNIKSKFKDFYKNRDFVSIMKHKFPGSSSLNDTNRKKIIDKLKNYKDNLDFLDLIRVLGNKNQDKEIRPIHVYRLLKTCEYLPNADTIEKEIFVDFKDAKFTEFVNLIKDNEKVELKLGEWNNEIYEKIITKCDSSNAIVLIERLEGRLGCSIYDIRELI